MRRLLAWSCLAAAVASGCIDRSRVNADCEWTDDSTFRIDTRDPAQWQHLIGDAQLAEELAIRYADREYGRRWGYTGHGGLIDHGEPRNACMARLVARIEDDHGVSAAQVTAARGQRNRTFDLAVALLFLPGYLVAATIACRAIRRRFLSDRRGIVLTATGFASVGASILGLQVFQLWLGVWEAVRVGNGHMSVFRLALYNRWSEHHLAAEIIGALILFWTVALLSYRHWPAEQAPSPHERGRLGALLR